MVETACGKIEWWGSRWAVPATLDLQRLFDPSASSASGVRPDPLSSTAGKKRAAAGRSLKRSLN